jgi:hypothetical protein
MGRLRCDIRLPISADETLYRLVAARLSYCRCRNDIQCAGRMYRRAFHRCRSAHRDQRDFVVRAHAFPFPNCHRKRHLESLGDNQKYGKATPPIGKTSRLVLFKGRARSPGVGQRCRVWRRTRRDAGPFFTRMQFANESHDELPYGKCCGADRQHM